MKKSQPSPARRDIALQLIVQKPVALKSAPSRTQLRAWIRAALRKNAQITVRLVGEKEGRALNRQYRGRDYATNVLTFVYHDSERAGLYPRKLEGDIVLCTPVIRKEALQQNKLLLAHYAHLAVHATLHLQGRDHRRPIEARRMEAQERRILRGLGYADPYSANQAA
jgi:probable rRNA maturation factor